MRSQRVSPVLLGVLVTLAFARSGFGKTQTAADSYFDFLLARHLEAQGDNTGAQRQLEAAVAEDPRSAEVRAELASFFLRRENADGAERAANEALAIDDTN